jgi:transposase
MRGPDFYAQILGITSPWRVSDVRLDVPVGNVEVIVEHRGTACCPQCGKSSPSCDACPQHWRHLDTCQLQTVLLAEVPRDGWSSP